MINTMNSEAFRDLPEDVKQEVLEHNNSLQSVMMAVMQSPNLQGVKEAFETALVAINGLIAIEEKYNLK